MSNLFHFLTSLSTDIKRQEVFGTDPDTILDAVGLSEANKNILKKGDSAGIASAIADELETTELLAIMGGCFLSDPGPDPSPDPDPPPPDQSFTCSI